MHIHTNGSTGDTMTKGVKIQYGDVAPEAKENFIPTVNEGQAMDFVDLEQLQIYNLQCPNYGNPLEEFSVLLDSTELPMPDDPENYNMGFWSKHITKADRTFETPIILTLTAEGKYTSQGFTITFDNDNDIFCNSMNIRWFQNGELMKDENGNNLDIDFTPNSAFYFCRKYVENYDKIVMTFYGMNMPYVRLKIKSLDYGYGTFFFGDELRNVKIKQQQNPICAELSANTTDFTLDSKTDMVYSFQNKQPLSTFFNDILRSTTFVTKSSRKAERVWSVQSEDYISMLSKLTFLGDIYENKNAAELLGKIFTQAKIPYNISDSLKSKTITGWLAVSDCREVVRQICYAIGAVVSTANSDKVNITLASNTISQTIPLTRIRQGQSFDEQDRVTAVSLTAHKWVKKPDETTELYKAEDSGTGEGILVKFSSPMYDLSITNGSIVENKYSANFAVINANAGCVLTGKSYEDVTTIHEKVNPVVASTDLENVCEVTDATLINSDNVNEILELTYNYAVKRHTTKLKIYEGGHVAKWGEYNWGTFPWGGMIYDPVVNVGEIITAETEYLGDVTGRIESMNYNCDGGILVKECEMK